MTNTWTVHADGSVTFDGTLTFPAGTNTVTGAGIAVFGPNGGTTNFGAIAQGAPGPAPTLTVTTTQVASGTSLPSPNPAVTFTPGSGGTPPNYALNFYVNAGATGSSGTTTILTATDIEGTAQDGYMIGYKAADTKAQWQPKLVGGYYYGGTISATTSNTVTLKAMTSISVPSKPFAWWPEVFAYGNVIGAVDTRVDLVARVGSTTGPECGRGYGAAGASPPPVVCIPNRLASGSDNIIAAGSAATIFLNAENQTASPNAWNTTSAAFFQVKVAPVPA